MSNEQDYTNIQGKRVFTGVDVFDRAIGGIPDGSLLIMTGRPGSGFEIFAQQMAYAKASAGECRVHYLNVESTWEGISAQMLSKGWDINQLMQDKKWKFLDGYTPRLNVRSGTVGPKVMVDLLGGLPKSIKAEDWSVIDSLSYYLSNHDLKEILGFVDDIMIEAREKGGLHLILVADGLHDPKVVNTIVHHADAQLSFSLDETQTEPIGTMRVVKLRKAEEAPRSIPYRITNTGLSIETASRIA
jgi:KaiC/GvpD/RAD55 family RecA-like ATPase